MEAAQLYFNEFDKFPAAWLGRLFPGAAVDSRSIKDVAADDVRGFQRSHFFGGIGGWELALRIAGWPEDRPVWTGSCPCQPFSTAGKGEAENDPRHLWPDFLRLIDAGRPATVFGEQVASPAGRRWLSRVRTDLEALGYEFGAADLCAAGVGAPHIRQRLYWVANANSAFISGQSPTRDQPFYGISEKPYWVANAELLRAGTGISGIETQAGSGGGADLQSVVLLAGWPTPCATNGEKHARSMEGALREAEKGRAMNDLGTTSQLSHVSTEKPGALNPAFVRWLMGFPPEWDACAVTATR